jgi:EAL domain-containing protein (putative c-di-GMP-specific phosphodiesterase class I)
VIVDATVRLAASFGLDVIGEGVETTQMAHELLRLGCYRAQGFLLCRPKGAFDLTPVLQDGGLDLASFIRHDDSWATEGPVPDPQRLSLKSA